MEFLTYNDLITNKYLGDNTLPFNVKGLIALMISCNCAMTFEKIKEYSCESEKELLEILDLLHDLGIAFKKNGKYCLTEEINYR